ncbi:MAG: hypothetical protein WBC44_15180 [Planctomycetaceae bacterium]
MPRQLTPRERLAADLTGAIDKAKTLFGSRVIVERFGGLSADFTIGLSRWRVRAVPSRHQRGAWHVFEASAYAAPKLVERSGTAGKAVGYIACLVLDDASEIQRLRTTARPRVSRNRNRQTRKAG